MSKKYYYLFREAACWLLIYLMLQTFVSHIIVVVDDGVVVK